MIRVKSSETEELTRLDHFPNSKQVRDDKASDRSDLTLSPSPKPRLNRHAPPYSKKKNNKLRRRKRKICLGRHVFHTHTREKKSKEGKICKTLRTEEKKKGQIRQYLVGIHGGRRDLGREREREELWEEEVQRRMEEEVGLLWLNFNSVPVCFYRQWIRCRLGWSESRQVGAESRGGEV